jgi:hypothetical protein
LRKRAIDVVLMSIGGNDVGFGALAVYSLTENMADLAPIAGLAGRSSRFAPQVSRAYLEVLDERMKALKEALRDGFGVTPSRVVQSSYEPIQYDETGALCGTQPTLGMDVHPGLKIGRQRLQETADFLRDFLGRLECLSGKNRAGCPADLATGAGTGFALVTEHYPGIQQARPLRPRSQARPRRQHRHAHAAQVDERRRLQAIFAGGHTALCSPVAPVPHAERRFPGGQHTSGRHTALRYLAAGLCGAL